MTLLARALVGWCRLRHGPDAVVEHRTAATVWRCATCNRVRGVTVYGPRPQAFHARAFVRSWTHDPRPDPPPKPRRPNDDDAETDSDRPGYRSGPGPDAGPAADRSDAAAPSGGAPSSPDRGVVH
jgi:hypothetical protein